MSVKKQKWKKLPLTGIIALALLMGTAAHAAEEIDLDKTGSLEIKFATESDAEPVVGAEFTIYMVQKWAEQDGAKTLLWIDGFEEAAGTDTLSSLKASELNAVAKTLAEYTESQKITGTTKATGSDGKVKFSGLSLGVYLVVWTDQFQNYSEMDPFLIFLPYEDDEGNLWYEISATPKTDPASVEEPTSTPTKTPEPTPQETPRPVPKSTPNATPEPTPEEEEPTLTPTPTPTATASASVSPSSSSDDEMWDDYEGGPWGAVNGRHRLPQTGRLNWPIPVLGGGGLLLFLTGCCLAKKTKKGRLLLAVGTVLIAGGAGILIYNSWDNARAVEASEKVLILLEQETGETLKEAEEEIKEEVQAEEVTETEEVMEEVDVEGYEYIGAVTIPAIDVTLPVMKELTYAGLKIAPCRYQGNYKDNSLIIAAHNYPGHFGNIYLLSQGDEVVFKDVEGVEYSYEVERIEILDGDAVEEMEEGEWDLTLFTCTYGGQNRITVRCSFINEI